MAIIGVERTLINTIRKRERKCIGHILRGASLLIKGYGRKMKGKKTSGRSRQMMLDWMMTDGHGKLKEEVQQSTTRRVVTS